MTLQSETLNPTEPIKEKRPTSWTFSDKELQAMLSRYIGISLGVGFVLGFIIGYFL